MDTAHFDFLYIFYLYKIFLPLIIALAPLSFVLVSFDLDFLSSADIVTAKSVSCLTAFSSETFLSAFGVVCAETDGVAVNNVLHELVTITGAD